MSSPCACPRCGSEDTGAQALKPPFPVRSELSPRQVGFQQVFQSLLQCWVIGITVYALATSRWPRPLYMWAGYTLLAIAGLKEGYRPWQIFPGLALVFGIGSYGAEIRQEQALGRWGFRWQALLREGTACLRCGLLWSEQDAIDLRA